MGFMRVSYGTGWCCYLSVAVSFLAAICCHGQGVPTKGEGTSTRQSAAEAIATKTNVELMVPARPAIEKGLKYLATRQQEDGAFSNSGYGRNAAVVALSGMAWLAGGSTPDRGPYGKEVRKVSEYLLDHCEQSGFISVEGAQSHGPMYEHGFATLFLAEVYGMSPRDDIREKLARAVDLIVRTQNAEGGWRYQPRREDADISVTICQVMALRAARNAGVYVPSETISRCIDYVKRCQNADGGFMYQSTGGPSRYPRSAAGLVALYSAGVYEGDEVTRALEYLAKNPPQKQDFGGDTHAMYGHYYAVQAMWQAGGEPWRKWYPAIQDLLLAQQRPDGSWQDIICEEYGTSMACIILQMPNNLLPIFQR
jgi:Squalene-hopene cyclase C-terminal domain/Prenyltransferase and squalene oxidase repeat